MTGRVKKLTGRVLQDVRLDGTRHRLARTEGGKQRKCAVEEESKQGLHMGDC